MQTVIKSYYEKEKKNSKRSKLVRQCKVMRDGEKTEVSDSGKVSKLASGIGFAEFVDHACALYAVQYLNNMNLTANRGLIVEFALNDAQKVR